MRLIDADEIKIRLPFKLPRYNMMLLRESIIQGIQDTPTVDAEPVRHRHWERHEGDLFCSSCGRVTHDRHDEFSEFEGMKIIALKRPYYCSYCGAKMDEEAEDEEGTDEA